jgi:hypothetical protein
MADRYPTNSIYQNSLRGETETYDFTQRDLPRMAIIRAMKMQHMPVSLDAAPRQNERDIFLNVVPSSLVFIASPISNDARRTQCSEDTWRFWKRRISVTRFAYGQRCAGGGSTKG